MYFNGSSEEWKGAYFCQASMHVHKIRTLSVFCSFECNGIITEIENKNEPITFSIEFTMMEADETFIVIVPIMKVEMRRSAVMSVERNGRGRKMCATRIKLIYRLMDTKTWASNASSSLCQLISVFNNSSTL